MNELERRAQIEETWARRNVFAESMAVERWENYVARRDLGRLGCYGFPETPKVAPRPPVATVRGGFSLPALPARGVAIAHYARVSPDNLKALVTGLQALVRKDEEYAGR